MKRAEANAWLKGLYDQVPEVKCKGLCWDACGPIRAHPEEYKRIKERGVNLPSHERMMEEKAANGGHYLCPALGENNECAVHESRPMICRLWGTSDVQHCPYGCEVDGEYLPVPEAFSLLSHLDEKVEPMTPEEIRELLKTKPGYAEMVMGMTGTYTARDVLFSKGMRALGDSALNVSPLRLSPKRGKA